MKGVVSGGRAPTETPGRPPLLSLHFQLGGGLLEPCSGQSLPDALWKDAASGQRVGGEGQKLKVNATVP